VRFVFTGFVSPAATLMAGYMLDRTGTHLLSFTVVGAICLIGVPIAFLLPHPGMQPSRPPGVAY